MNYMLMTNEKETYRSDFHLHFFEIFAQVAAVIDMLKDRACETSDVEMKAEVSSKSIFLKIIKSF